MSTVGNWINEGPLRVRFSEEHGHLVKEWDQPDRELILSDIAEQRKAPQRRFLGGWKVGSVPLYDWHRIVLPKYPELAGTDKIERDKALVRFSNDPDMAPYLVKKA